MMPAPFRPMLAMEPTTETVPLRRREAIAWMMLAASAMAAPTAGLRGSPSPAPAARGYGLDPDLLRVYRPGELWPLTFTAAQRRTVVALCEVILPAEGEAPSAVAVGVPDFLDEWISAPYPEQRADRPIVLEGIAWIEAEARRRHGRDFADLTDAERGGLCSALCGPAPVAEELRSGAAHFRKIRHLVAGGYYTTPAGMKDLGYVGNVPLASFDGPPVEVLRRLGLE
jgi:hypothetical protein